MTHSRDGTVVSRSRSIVGIETLRTVLSSTTMKADMMAIASVTQRVGSSSSAGSVPRRSPNVWPSRRLTYCLHRHGSGPAALTSVGAAQASAGDAVLPIGEDGPEGSHQRQRLGEGDVVVRGGDLDDRGAPPEQLVDVVLHVGGDEVAVLAPEHGDPAVHVGQVVGDPLAMALED